MRISEQDGMARGCHRDRGQAVLLVAVVMLVAAAAAMSVARLGAAMVRQQQAQAAADAAALSAVDGGAVAARRVAAVNGARLVGVTVLGHDVVVEVVVGDRRATARATRAP